MITAQSIFKNCDIDEEIYVGVPSYVWASLALERPTFRYHALAGNITQLVGVCLINMEKVPGNDFFLAGTNFPDLTDAKVEYKDGKLDVLEPAKFTNPDIKYVLPLWCKSGVVFSQRKSIDVNHFKKGPFQLHDLITVTASFGTARVEPEKILGIEISHASLNKVLKVSSTTGKN